MRLHLFKAILIGSILTVTTILNAQEKCGSYSLNEAKKYFELGNFQKTIDQINPCLTTGFDENQQVEAYKLLAMTYLVLDSIELANEYGEMIFKLKPNYEADIYDPYFFKLFVNEIIANKGNNIVSSVSKKAENLEEAPATVVILTEEDIKQRGYTDLESFFSDLPGFDVSRTFGATYSNIYQRGYRSNNTDRTLFLVDGVEENDLWSNAAFWNMQYPVSNVKRVEIVYGPASTMYGANALVGVVNIITKEHDEILKDKHIAGNINTGIGTYNTKYLDATLAGSVKKISFSTTFKKYYSDEMDLSIYDEWDFDPNDFDQMPYTNLATISSNPLALLAKDANGYYQMQINGNDTVAVLTQKGFDKVRELDKSGITKDLNGNPIGYKNISDHYYFYGKLKISDLTLGYELWQSDVGGINYFHDNKQAGADNGSIWRQKQGFYYLKYEKSFGDFLQLTNFAQYRYSSAADGARSVALYNYSNGALTADQLVADFQPYWVTIHLYQLSRQLRNELKLTYNPIKNLNVISGFEVRQSSIQGDYRVAAYPDFVTSQPDTMPSVIEVGTSGGDALKGGNLFDILDFGAYTQGSYRFMNNFLFTVGGRYDYNKIRVTGGYKSQFNPRFALVYAPDKFVFKAIYARAFQNASNWTKYSSIPGRQLPNSELLPEKVTNIEASALMKITNDLNVNLIYFHSNYDGVVGTKKITQDDGTIVSMNDAIGQLKIQGINAMLNYKIGKKYKLYLNYTYTDPQENILDASGSVTGEYRRIGDISKHKINVGGNAVLFEKLNLNLRLNYIGDRETGPNTSIVANPGTFPAVTLLNASIGYFNLIKGLDLQLMCNNILDKEYFDPGIRSADGVVYSYRTPQHRRYFMIRLNYNF